MTRKRVPWGQTHSWVRLIWNPGKNYRNLSPKCLSDSDSGSVWPGFRVGLTPKWVWPPRTLFRVKSDPGVFRVYPLWSPFILQGGEKHLMTKLRWKNLNLNPRSEDTSPWHSYPSESTDWKVNSFSLTNIDLSSPIQRAFSVDHFVYRACEKQWWWLYSSLHYQMADFLSCET